VSNKEKVVSAARVILQIAVAVQCLVLGYLHLYGATPINDWLGMNAGAETAEWIDKIAGFSLILLAGMVLARPPRWPLVLISVWFLLFAIAHMLNHFGDEDQRFHLLAPAAQAIRFLAPLALACLISGAPRAALWFLVVGCAATFIGHGLKDIWHHVPYLDLINNSLANHTDIELTEGGAWSMEKSKMLLRGIGIADIIAAILLIGTRWRFVALIMGVWGLITAASRMTGGGLEMWPETFLRVCNWMGPFAIAVLVWALVRGHRGPSRRKKKKQKQQPVERSGRRTEAAPGWDFLPPDASNSGLGSSSSSSSSSPSSVSEGSGRDIYG